MENKAAENKFEKMAIEAIKKIDEPASYQVEYRNDDIDVLIISGVLAIVGLIFGIFAYSNSIPPRWFWSRSKDFIFEFSVTAVLGYAWNFATWPLAIYIIRLVVEEL